MGGTLGMHTAEPGVQGTGWGRWRQGPGCGRGHPVEEGTLSHLCTQDEGAGRLSHRSQEERGPPCHQDTETEPWGWVGEPLWDRQLHRGTGAPLTPPAQWLLVSLLTQRLRLPETSPAQGEGSFWKPPHADGGAGEGQASWASGVGEEGQREAGRAGRAGTQAQEQG